MAREFLDLSVVARELLWEAVETRYSGSVSAAARDLGVPQRTLQHFLSGETGGKLDMLSTALRGLQIDPISFFVRHKGYASLRPTWERNYSRAQFERLARILSAEEFAQVARMIETSKRLGLHDQIVEVVGKMIETARMAHARQPHSHKIRHLKTAKTDPKPR